MTTAIAADEPIQGHAAHAHDDVTLAVARVNALGSRGEIVRAELKPRWRVTEEEILRASFTVLLVALVTVIGVAASAIWTMG
ncbi:hypothetical protein A5634_22125 [Mycobacterium asiaticum]|uniref:Uncharacterized protein n=1 Tax=Mycobacterium asiaticum TaxID=1790 RepID=A0A1A3P0P3_MYCAS|nr:hypothetical protein [Mycobacterium asiaticum]OBK27756.1 hypothetical protein A5634_22125 [Mycobacterium asiaticum]